jgi:hypothetical protein
MSVVEWIRVTQEETLVSCVALEVVVVGAVGTNVLLSYQLDTKLS